MAELIQLAPSLAILLTGCTALGVAQQRDAAATALAAELVCFVEDASDGPAWYSTADSCIHYDPAQGVTIARQYGWGAVLGMYAHEVGHAIEHRDGRDHGDERAADRWAGCALARMGESMRSTEAFLTDRNPGPPAYESTDVRIADTVHGFNKCATSAND